MSNAARIWLVLVIILILSLGGYYISHQSAQQPVATEQGIHALFTCDNGKTADATFFEGTSTPSANPDMPPTSTATAHLILSDGRDMTLQQVVSADGARYATPDGSFVFWNVGNTATITETGSTTFSNCVTNS